VDGSSEVLWDINRLAAVQAQAQEQAPLQLQPATGTGTGTALITHSRSSSRPAGSGPCLPNTPTEANQNKGGINKYG
jgi:hypothetical protein